MDKDRISRLTNPELALFTAAVLFLLLAVFISDGFLRILALTCGIVCGGGVYLLVARRLNERHVDSVVASKETAVPEKRSGNFHVDPQTKRLVFDDYVLSFPPDDNDDADDFEEERSLEMGSFRKVEGRSQSATTLTAAPGDEVRVKVHRPAAIPETAQRNSPQPQEQILLAEEKPSHKRKELNVPISELFDFASGEQQNEPRNEFDSLLNRVLHAIREIVEAHSVVFFWVDKGSSRLIIEAKVSESNTFVPRRKIDFGHDIVSQIAASGLPEVLTEINPNAEMDLLGYYEQPNGIRSFVGVPIYFNHDVVAILTLDAKAEDAYDARTVKVLGHFAKIISGLIRGYTDKYDLHLSARAVHAVEKLRSALPPHTATSEKIARALLGVAEDVVDWEWASVAMFDNGSKDWTLLYTDARRNQPYVESKQKIDLQRSITGSVIRSGQPMVVNDISGQVRFHPDERSYSEGAFLCLPLSTPLRSYGALSIEHPAKNNFNQHDVNVLLVLAQTAAAMIESFHLNKMIDEQLMIDERTGIYNKRFLLSRLDEDISRAEDYEEQLSFVLFGIDDPAGVAEKLGAERVDSVLASIAKIITQHVRMYDAVGRYDNQCIGIVLVGKTDEEAYLWTEKVRKDIASTVLTLGTKKLSITASAGICGIRHQATHVDLVNGSIQALERAHEIGGNTIMVY